MYGIASSPNRIRVKMEKVVSVSVSFRFLFFFPLPQAEFNWGFLSFLFSLGSPYGWMDGWTDWYDFLVEEEEEILG